MFNKEIWIGGSIAIIGLLIGILSGPEPDECQLYNEMRQIWEETNGDYGWPKGAIKECEYES